MAGELIKYYTVQKDDRFYVEYGRWADREHLASFFNRETAERIQRRYPGSVVSGNHGYDIWFKTFEDVGEPEATQALASAVRLATQDGLSLETILVNVERTYHAIQNSSEPDEVSEIEKLRREFAEKFAALAAKQS